MATDVWGISDGYEDAFGAWQATSADTRAAILTAMGVGESSPLPGEDVVRVIRAGAAPPLPARGELALEDGATLRVGGSLPPDLPLGYHELRPEAGGAPVHVIVCPSACALPAGMREWGFALQLYALRSARSWGIGDAGDLREFARWSGELGGRFTLINPLGSGTPVAPLEASPYFPSSRRYRDPLYVRVEEAPGAAELAHDLEPVAAAGRALNLDRRIDRDAILRLKLDALGRLFARFRGDPAFDRYCAAEGPSLTEFATFCALAEGHGRRWRHWPVEYRRPDTAAVRGVAESEGRVRFHRWVQWVVDAQLAAAAREGRIVQDLPIGFAPDGADAWAWQEHLATDVTVGAPPDRYVVQGQDWGFPPFVPHRLRADGYAPFVQTIRSVLRHAGGLRIDHVMGLFRLFWVPRGMAPARGTYVGYRADELLGIVALESHRAGAVVVGEDLGTVEAGVRDRLAAERILGCRVLWLEDTPPAKFPVLALASVTTHDLPTIAGLWSGSDVREQRAIGLDPSEEGLREIRERLRAWIGVREGERVEQVAYRTHRLLADAPSAMIVATLEDVLGLEARPNMPGTTGAARSNWSVALPLPLEALREDARARACAETLGRRRVKAEVDG
jgi:4-alpha-glucanotransferase